MRRSGILLVGPNGCGKGTQAEKIKEEFRYCHIATGDLLREQVEKGTELGKQAKVLMESGKLVADDIVIGMVKDKIASKDCESGFMLDGFPRTVPQAEALDKILSKEGWKLNSAIHFKVDHATVMERTGGRLLHKASGRTYHVLFKPPKVPGKDDVTGEPLFQRPDDQPVVVKKRLEEYESKTAPVLNYYSSLVKNIDAEAEPKVVEKDIMAVLHGKPAPSMATVDSDIARVARRLLWLVGKKSWN